ncbi:T9SS type B sorting domain-containing protein [Aureivirga sp. CE67]|uniref:T9SS type B sorting domain-containing protein n=1 Tax=Aureivirga sp. CE67 TaxID=1788983 RepID=UPI0018CAD6BD|nr:T9SS type B sorting domain-containing protein [Aureivirga sp. CE67]
MTTNYFKIVKILFLFLFFQSLQAQKESNIWYFGYKAGLDFNSGSPVALTDGELITDEGCATISNAEGELLFYTDGITVYNKNHEIMENGTGLMGNYSSTSSAIIVPKPDSEHIYYVFTVGLNYAEEGFRYSEVDMNLDGGNGAITESKNILLESEVTEKLTAIRNNQTNEYWVLSHRWESNEFVSYKVTSSGVIETPVVSAVGIYVGNIIGAPAEAIGQIKFSPNGKKAVVVRTSLPTELYDFDKETGILSNAMILSTASSEYGAEFSPDSHFLYLCQVYGNNLSNPKKGLKQFDITLSTPEDIINSEILISTTSKWRGALQLATDGKIYVACHDSGYLDVIHNPNELGLSCNFEDNGVYLGGKNSLGGLPAFNQSFFKLSSIKHENSCLGETTNFTLVNAEGFTNISWDFGDITSGDNTAVGDNVSHEYTSPGEYTVTVTADGLEGDISEEITVTIYEVPQISSISNLEVCDEDNNGFWNFDFTEKNEDLLNGQDESIFEVKYFTSLENIEENQPIENPENYENTTAYTQEKIYGVVRNKENIDCYAMTEFTIQVFDTPIISETISVFEKCDDESFGSDSDGLVLFDLTDKTDEILNGFPEDTVNIYFFTDNNTEDLSTAIPNPEAFQNTTEIQTIYVKVMNKENEDCFAETSFMIQVNVLPVVNTFVELSQCDDDMDGFTTYNLEESFAEISTNYENETITFYINESDAILGENAILNTTNFQNPEVSNSKIWARIENEFGCFRTSEIDLIVSTSQIPVDYHHTIYQCDNAEDGNANNGIVTFDFSFVHAEIETMFPAGQELIISYYENQSDALAEQNAITNTSSYTNTSSPNQQEIYIRVENLLNNDCIGLGHHITLVVENIPEIYDLEIPVLCDENGDSLVEFDTSLFNETLTGGQENVILEYFGASGNSLGNSLPNPFESSTQTITVHAINNISQDPNGACYMEKELQFEIFSIAAFNVLDKETCDDDFDGIFSFDTSTIEQEVLNGQTGMIVTYKNSNGEVLPSPLPNPFTTGSDTITVRVENAENTACYEETTFSFVVYETPIANEILDYFVCDDASNDGINIFDLAQFNSEILGNQSEETFEISYYLSQENADSKEFALDLNYENIENPQTIFARIENKQKSDCFATTSFTIGIYEMPTIAEISTLEQCDDESNDGIAIFDLSEKNEEILASQISQDFNITYHLSELDAISDINSIATNYEGTATEIFVRIENEESESCFVVNSFLVEVLPLPDFDLEPEQFLCRNYTKTLSVSEEFDTYLWSTGETTNSIEVSEIGNYTVTVGKYYPSGMLCERTKEVEVILSEAAKIFEIKKEDWTFDSNSIHVLVGGVGDYEYSIDGEYYQDEPVFENLQVNDYTVFIRDKNGCGVVNDKVFLLYYPQYFTPNGDGIHDFWQLNNAEGEKYNQIFIFDRYGKLITKFIGKDKGWDGTFQGEPMPSSDYWFLLKRTNGKEYRGHFTLKR